MSELDELIAHLETQKTTPTVDRLLSKVKEQDREIERLLSYVDGNDKDAELDCQRRHRKWALERLKSALYNLFVIVPRMKKAEAELEECHGRLMAYRDSTTELIASEQTLKAEREKLIGALGKISIECSKWPNLGCSAPVCDIIRAVSAEKEKV